MPREDAAAALWEDHSGHAATEEVPDHRHEDQAARSARDERDAQAYAQRHQLAATALLDLDWCVACGYGHVDGRLSRRRLSWAHGSVGLKELVPPPPLSVEDPSDLDAGDEPMRRREALA
jgi:hypothetical protein